MGPRCAANLMDIFYGRTRKVPKPISLEMLAKIVVLVDYYECVEVVEIYSTIWIEDLKQSTPAIYSRDSMLWMCMSCVFRAPVLFQAAASAALKYSQGPIQTVGLLISEKVISKTHH
jgi:hypothetical protein